MKWNKNASSQKGRVFRSGLLSTAMLAAVLVLAVLLNLLVRAIPTKYTEFDLSEAKMYTLSDSTKALVEGLEKDVHIYYLCETGSEDAIITKLLDHYAAESGHLSWEQKDPTLYPTFAAKYGAENVSTGSLIVTCGENSTVLDAADLYEYDYTDYYTTGSASVTFGGEKQITSAIYKLTAAGQSHAYYTTNHGEQSLTDSLTDALDAQNIDAQPLDLLTSTIPEDCNLLIINAPTSDFTAGDGLVDEIAQLQTYLENGGHLFVTTDLTVSTPNLDALLAEYGMTRQEGLVIENDSSYYLYGTAQTCLLPNLSSNEITAGVTDGMHVFTPVAQGIVKGDSTDDLTLTTLLSTSSTAYAMQDYAQASTAEQGANDPNGPFNIAVAASNSTTGAKVVWVNCANLLNSKGIEYVAREYASLLIGGNAQLLTSTVNWMTGEENGVVIDSKSMSAETLTVPAKATMLLGLLFTIVVPLAFIVAGIAITLVRRRR